MRSIAGLFVLILLLAAAGCSTATTGADYDENLDFRQYHSFDWLPKEEWARPDAMAQNDRVARAIANAIADNLTSRGYLHVADNPQLRVTFLTGVRDSLGTTAWGYGYGGREEHGGFVPTSNYREGRLIIDFYDAQTTALVWRGWAEAEVGGYDDAMVRLAKIVDEVLAQFPPPPPAPKEQAQ